MCARAADQCAPTSVSFLFDPVCLRRCLVPFGLSFHLNSNLSDEAQHFARHSRDHFLNRLSTTDQLSVAFTESLLRPPRDVYDFLAEPFLPFLKRRV